MRGVGFRQGTVEGDGFLGGLQAFVTTPVIAAWTGFIAAITQFLPFLRRFLDWAVEVLRNILPFAFGFIFGTIGGVFKSGAYVSTSLFRPIDAAEACCER